jgi:hypothetical protein
MHMPCSTHIHMYASNSCTHEHKTKRHTCTHTESHAHAHMCDTSRRLRWAVGTIHTYASNSCTHAHNTKRKTCTHTQIHTHTHTYLIPPGGLDGLSAPFTRMPPTLAPAAERPESCCLNNRTHTVGVTAARVGSWILLGIALVGRSGSALLCHRVCVCVCVCLFVYVYNERTHTVGVTGASVGSWILLGIALVGRSGSALLCQGVCVCNYKCVLYVESRSVGKVVPRCVSVCVYVFV